MPQGPSQIRTPLRFGEKLHVQIVYSFFDVILDFYSLPFTRKIPLSSWVSSSVSFSKLFIFNLRAFLSHTYDSSCQSESLFLCPPPLSFHVISNFHPLLGSNCLELLLMGFSPITLNQQIFIDLCAGHWWL